MVKLKEMENIFMKMVNIIGEWKNGLRNGKGTYYYANGKMKYEGDYINDKFEGNGKCIWEDDEYYIGEYKYGLRH